LSHPYCLHYILLDRQEGGQDPLENERRQAAEDRNQVSHHQLIANQAIWQPSQVADAERFQADHNQLIARQAHAPARQDAAESTYNQLISRQAGLPPGAEVNSNQLSAKHASQDSARIAFNQLTARQARWQPVQEAAEDKLHVSTNQLTAEQTPWTPVTAATYGGLPQSVQVGEYRHQRDRKIERELSS
jgi:hypothetical protein